MTNHENSVLQMERVVFFSDAVFAIAITLLIIEIKVPHLEYDAANREFWIALLQSIPKFTGYFLSFFVIGTFWIGHHQIYGYIVRWDYGLVWRNVWFLMSIAFIPFSTAFYSEYPGRFVPLFLYALTFTVAAFLENWQWRYALKSELTNDTLARATVSQLSWRFSVLPFVGLAVILIGLVTPRLAGFAFLLIPILQGIIKKRFAEKTEKTEIIKDELTTEN